MKKIQKFKINNSLKKFNMMNLVPRIKKTFWKYFLQIQSFYKIFYNNFFNL